MDDVISLGVGEPDFATPRPGDRGRHRQPARGADPLHQQLRDDRAAAGDRRPPRAPLRRPLRPRDRDPRHGRRLGGGRPRPAGDRRSGRRGDPPRAVVRRLRPGDRLRRRDRPPRGDPLRGRLRARPGRGRGGGHAADEGALPRLPVQPDRAPSCRRRSRTSWPRIAVRHDLLVYSRRDLRPARLRRLPPPGDERPARDARADDPHGRLLQGLRDDRLAGRLRSAPRPAILEGIVKVHQYGIMSAPTDRPGRGPRGAPDGRGRRRGDAGRVRPAPAAPRGRPQRARPRDLRAAGRLLRLPADHLDRPGRRGVRGARCSPRSTSPPCPGSAFGPSGGGPRPDVLRDQLREARGGAAAHRPLRRAAP